MSLPTNETELQELIQEKENLELSEFDLDFLILRTAEYLQTNRLNDVVLGVSGGVDSSLVLALLSEVQRTKHPFMHIHTMCITYNQLPIDRCYVETLKSAFSSSHRDVDMTRYGDMLTADLYLLDLQRVLPQSLYALRYHALFTLAQDVGGVTFGTTNADELRYVGWFGKNSDMMVDVQPIWWLSKHLVKYAAKELGVPDSIINRAPVGDLVDLSTDEDNFGCTYSELSWFSTLKDKTNLNEFLTHKFSKVIALHEKNKHKYYRESMTSFNPIFL